MAITFPRDMPDFRSMTGEPFRLRRFQSSDVAGGGNPQVAELAPPLWRGSWTVEALDRALGGTWEAWLESLRGGLRLFKGIPPKNRWPILYPRGFAGLLVSGSPFTGSGNLLTIGAGRDTVTVSALPVGLVLSAGDFLSIPVGSRQHLHKIIEGGVANGSGQVALTVEPTIRPNATTGVAVRLADPFCDMVLEPGWSSSYRGTTKTFSFSGLQVLT
jgi:hypothetical protein